MTRKALGKGLSALLREFEGEGEVGPAAGVAVAREGAEPQGPGFAEIAVELVDPSPFQPRAQFSAPALEELAQSIRSGGVVQPIVVRPWGARYQLVAGERRLRAAKLAGMARVPALVRILSDEQAVGVSLIENLQREDLNALEQARAFERLTAEFGLTQEEVATRTGKDRATVANILRLLRLPAEVQEMLEAGRLSAGHARALLKLEPNAALQVVLGRRIAARRLSVRQAEAMVEGKLPGAPRRRLAGARPDPNLTAAQEQMERALGTRVRLVEKKGGRGRIEIDYYSLEDLNRLYRRIVEPQS